VGYIYQVVFAQEHLPVNPQRCFVFFNQYAQLLNKFIVIEVRNQRRIILDKDPAINFLCKLR